MDEGRAGRRGGKERRVSIQQHGIAESRSLPPTGRRARQLTSLTRTRRKLTASRSSEGSPRVVRRCASKHRVRANFLDRGKTSSSPSLSLSRAFHGDVARDSRQRGHGASTHPPLEGETDGRSPSTVRARHRHRRGSLDERIHNTIYTLRIYGRARSRARTLARRQFPRRARRRQRRDGEMISVIPGSPIGGSEDGDAG